MTRINTINPQELNGKMLVAEYRELPRLRHLHPRKTMPNIPTYRLGTGHVLFFANKGRYLEKRHYALVREMLRRRYKVNLPALQLDHWPKSCMNNWTPSESDMDINRRRIRDRINHAIAKAEGGE